MVSKSERESPWYEYGTDKEYQDYCRTLPCAVSGIEEDVIFAHHRNAGNAGWAFKPPYSGVPMNSLLHIRQHEVGQYVFKTRMWWEQQCKYHLIRWARTKGYKG